MCLRGIRIRVNYYGILREVTGKKSEELTLESSSLEDLLENLSKRFRDPFKKFFFREEDLHPQINIFINHVIIPLHKIPETILRHEDQIDLFVPASGG
jgi:MoaD family protein